MQSVVIHNKVVGILYFTVDITPSNTQVLQVITWPQTEAFQPLIFAAMITLLQMEKYTKTCQQSFRGKNKSKLVDQVGQIRCLSIEVPIIIKLSKVLYLVKWHSMPISLLDLVQVFVRAGIIAWD